MSGTDFAHRICTKFHWQKLKGIEEGFQSLSWMMIYVSAHCWHDLTFRNQVGHQTRMVPVWPDVGIKSSHFFELVAQNVATEAFTYKSDFLKISQRVAQYLGYFCKKICCQDLSKMAQSGWCTTRSNSPNKKQKFICYSRHTVGIVVLLPNERWAFKFKRIYLTLKLGPILEIIQHERTLNILFAFCSFYLCILLLSHIF